MRKDQKHIYIIAACFWVFWPACLVISGLFGLVYLLSCFAKKVRRMFSYTLKFTFVLFVGLPYTIGYIFWKIVKYMRRRFRRTRT